MSSTHLLQVIAIALLMAQPLMFTFAQERATAIAPYANPVLGDPQRPDPAIADPFVLKWNGEYYLYCTGDPITAYHSLDLVNWTLIGPVLSSSDKPDAWNQADVWAPEVVYRNGKFYMYYTASKRSDDWRVGEMARRIGVAVSDSPRGPFVDSGRPVTPGWGIDGHIFKDPDTGEEHHFYSYLYEPRLPGAGIVVDRQTNWNSMAARPSHVTRGSEAWEDKDGDPNNGSLRYTNEAPTVIKRHGRYYMMYSGGSWDLPTYSLAYATADSVLQGGLDGPGWRKVVPPILRSTALVEAPGHNSLVKAPNNVDDICVYHARVVPFRGPGDRLTFVDRLYWNHDRMYMEPPALGDLAPPDRPLFADNFNRADGAIGNDWQASGGQWRVAEGQARQSQAGAGIARAIPRAEKLSHYVFEANVRSAAAQRTPSAHVGVSAYYVDAKNHIDVWLDRDRMALITNGMLNGVAVPKQETKLPPGYRFDAYHQILVTKNADRISIAIDGVNLQSRTFDSIAAPATVALQTLNTPADFDGVALTAYFEDSFDNPQVTWTAGGGTWLAEEGALHQVGGGAGRSIALKGDAAENYEFTASLRWRDNESVASVAGIVAAATDAGEMVLAGFDKTIWPFARFRVQRVAQGEVKDSFAVGLPRGFNYDVYHTIRVVRQGSAFTFYLDGKETAAARFPVGAARPGLFTEGVRAAFDDCAMKRLTVPQNLLLNGGFESEQGSDGAASQHNPWKFSGKARPNDCCAHSGQRRLVIQDGDGEATQVIEGLAPGRYTLRAWVTTTGGTEAEIRVTPSGAAAKRASAVGEKWTRVSVDFDVPQGQRTASVAIGARMKGGAQGLVAADDFYLFRN
ncbi:MAG TPA: family 43 glycosylhydrolase [Blastocatellia bacterium]|nr:family 43 glycosylhydrolase [Blastocatellia bacterium]